MKLSICWTRDTIDSDVTGGATVSLLAETYDLQLREDGWVTYRRKSGGNPRLIPPSNIRFVEPVVEVVESPYEPNDTIPAPAVPDNRPTVKRGKRGAR